MNLDLFYTILLASLIINISFVSIYLILVLSDLRKTIKKFDEVLDDLSVVSDHVAHPMKIFNGVFGVVSNFLNKSDSVRSIRR